MQMIPRRSRAIRNRNRALPEIDKKCIVYITSLKYKEMTDLRPF